MAQLDIYSIEWMNAPEGFDQTGTLFNVQLADTYQGQLILALDVDIEKASLALDGIGRVADTLSTQDWPVFDTLFGRDAWKGFLREWEDDTKEMLRAHE